MHVHWEPIKELHCNLRLLGPSLGIPLTYYWNTIFSYNTAPCFACICVICLCIMWYKKQNLKSSINKLHHRFSKKTSKCTSPSMNGGNGDSTLTSQLSAEVYRVYIHMQWYIYIVPIVYMFQTMKWLLVFALQGDSFSAQTGEHEPCTPASGISPHGEQITPVDGETKTCTHAHAQVM